MTRTKNLLDTFDKRIKTCSYIDSSELFKDCNEAWNLFVECVGNECDWGNNDISLISTKVIANTLEAAPMMTIERYQVEIIFKRIDELGFDFLINLES